MQNHILHKVMLPNGLRATLMAKVTGDALVIVRLYILMPSGEYRGVDLPTDDSEALEILDYIRSRDPRFLLQQHGQARPSYNELNRELQGMVSVHR